MCLNFVIVVIINLNIRKNVYIVNNFLILDSFSSSGRYKDDIIMFEFAAIIARIVIINLNIRRNVYIINKFIILNSFSSSE